MKKVVPTIYNRLIWSFVVGTTFGACTPTAPITGQCRDFYQRIYGDAPLIRAVVAFGYKDSRPTRLVTDRYELGALLDRLLAGGWKRKGEVGRILLTKTVQLAPPIAPRARTIELEIVSSSLGADDEVSRKDPFQKTWSEKTEATWSEALTSADWVFYNGHSRDGGGPDFKVPTLTADGHVEYTRYERERVELKRTLQALDNANRLKLLGVYSCASSRHFKDAVQARAKSKGRNLALITSSKLLYWTDALEAAASHLETWTESQCPSERRELTFGMGTELSF